MRRSDVATVFVLTGILGGLLVAGCSSDDSGQKPVPCSITLTSPESGDIYTVPPPSPDEDQIEIFWDAAGGGNVRVELLKGGDAVGDIVDSTPNDGFYFWTIDDLVPGSGSDYAVRVTSLEDAGCTDTSPEVTINDMTSCSVEVDIDYPGLDTERPANAGELMFISWTALSGSGNFDIEFWTAPPAVGDELIGYIAEDVTGTSLVGGWVMDSFHRGDGLFYQIRVRDRGIGTCVGESETFEMIDDELCEIEYWTPMPASGDLIEGTNVEIQWTATNTTGLVTLELWYGNQSRAGVIAVGVDAYPGLYNWTVTDFDYLGQSTSNYKIRIEDADDEYCWISSPNLSIPR